MITHPSWARLLAYGNGESDPRVASHLTGCEACRERVIAGRALRIAAEDVMSPPPPAGGWEKIQISRREGRSVILPVPTQGPRRRPMRPAVKAAVLILLGGSGGLAASVAVGPLLDLVRDRPAAEVPAAAPEPRRAGVAIPVDRGPVRVVLRETGPDLRIHVELTTQPLLEVEGVGAASNASFRPGANRVTVLGAVSGSVWIGLPSGHGPYVVEMDGRDIITSDGRSLRVLGDPLDRTQVTVHGAGGRGVR